MQHNSVRWLLSMIVLFTCCFVMSLMNNKITKLTNELDHCRSFNAIPTSSLDEFILAGHPFRLLLPKMIECTKEIVSEPPFYCSKLDADGDGIVTNRDIDIRMESVRRDFVIWRRAVYNTKEPMEFLNRMLREAETW